MRGCSALLLALLLVATAAAGILGLGVWRSGSPARQPIAELPVTAAAVAATVLAAPSIPTPAPAVTPIVTPTVTPAPPYLPAQPAALLTGVRHEWQTWNNCGPATLAMNLSYFGSSLRQADIGAVLRPYPDDKNVSPHELVQFAQRQGYRAVELVNGSDDLLRTLVSNGIPVLLETWHEPAPDNGLGHYRLLVGYDDSLQEWTLYDSYDSAGLISTADYAGIRMEAARLAAWWKVFNRAFVLVYPPAMDGAVAAILADFGVTPEQMWQAAEAQARGELAANDDDAFAWFNLGSSLTAQGRTAEAALAFDRAREIGLPWRMFWYQFAPFAAYLAEGRTTDVLELTATILEVTDSIEEIAYWRARALLATGDRGGARLATERALALAPGFAPAAALLAQLDADGQQAP